jgi:hypothetical protein
MIRAGRNAFREPALRPTPAAWFVPGGRGASARADGMTIFQEIVFSITIAMCAVTVGKLIWSALAAVW